MCPEVDCTARSPEVLNTCLLCPACPIQHLFQWSSTLLPNPLVTHPLPTLVLEHNASDSTVTYTAPTPGTAPVVECVAPAAMALQEPNEVPTVQEHVIVQEIPEVQVVREILHPHCSFHMEMTTATIHNTLRLSAHWLNRNCLHFSLSPSPFLPFSLSPLLPSTSCVLTQLPAFYFLLLSTFYFPPAIYYCLVSTFYSLLSTFYLLLSSWVDCRFAVVGGLAVWVSWTQHRQAVSATQVVSPSAHEKEWKFMDTLKNFDNKVGKDCEKNGLCTCTRKEKIRLITI